MIVPARNGQLSSQSDKDSPTASVRCSSSLQFHNPVDNGQPMGTCFCPCMQVDGAYMSVATLTDEPLAAMDCIENAPSIRAVIIGKGEDFSNADGRSEGDAGMPQVSGFEWSGCAITPAGTNSQGEPHSKQVPVPTLAAEQLTRTTLRPAQSLVTRVQHHKPASAPCMHCAQTSRCACSSSACKQR
jgi:hypothetical protein